MTDLIDGAPATLTTGIAQGFDAAAHQDWETIPDAGHRHHRRARFPWESALDGTEQIPPPTSVNSEGIYEQHITADVALAQWQYYLATGDRAWLASHGYVRVQITAATYGTPPMLEEITVPGGMRP